MKKNNITICIFGAEGATRTELLAAFIDKLKISSVYGRFDSTKPNQSNIPKSEAGRFSSTKPNFQEVEKDTGQIRLFFDPPQSNQWIHTNEKEELPTSLMDYPGVREKLEEIKEIAEKVNKKRWYPHKGERVACYQEGDKVYRIMPFHTATNGNFSPTERYYDHIKRYSGQESMLVSTLKNEPEFKS